MLKGNPCRVTFYSEHKSGKHGSCKCNFGGRDIFTGKDYTYCYTSSDTVYKPIVTKTEFVCQYVQEDGFLSLITEDGTQKEDVKIPTEDHLKEIAKRINEICEAGEKECLVTVQKWGNKEQACHVREGQSF